jgi:hypothetical protein
MPNIEQPLVEFPQIHLRDRDSVQHFLDDFAHALVAGDGKAITKLWEVPAYVIGDDGSMLVTSLDQVEQFYGQAKAQYNDRGITATHPDLQRVDWVTNRICIVDVRWPWIDADNNEVGEESSLYVLRRDDNGELKLRVALMKGGSRSH